MACILRAQLTRLDKTGISETIVIPEQVTMCNIKFRYSIRHHNHRRQHRSFLHNDE